MVKKTLQNIALSIVSLVVTLLIVEGVYALVRGGQLDTSLSFKALYLMTQAAPGHLQAVPHYFRSRADCLAHE